MNGEMLQRNALHDLIMQVAYKDCMCHHYARGMCTRCAALELAQEAFPVHFFKVVSILTSPWGLINGKVPRGLQP